MTAPSPVVHPTYGGPTPPPVPDGCPCCERGTVDPTFRLCTACWSKAVRLMQCVHGRPS